VLVSIRRVCCVNGVYLRGVRVLAGGFFNVVWLLPLVLFVCLGFSVKKTHVHGRGTMGWELAPQLMQL